MSLAMDVYILRFHHEKLQQKSRIKYAKVEEPIVVSPELGYEVGEESDATFDKESSQTFEGSEGLGFEEVAQPQEPIVDDTFVNVGEELGEELSRTSSSVREDVGRTSASDGEDFGGTSSATVAI
ncbi:hypothetical protein RDI58_024564 [Solanum bulbocastanum]|uniref:Uncharacterized protein n=1 Tax=Solanum bulbocastanum TaxID=147425 RepID=A0AAN8T650_SOLBU